jgi:MFS family permease
MSLQADAPLALTPAERRASLSLSSVIGLRMLGLFLMLPVMAVGARDLPGGTDPTLVGLALGVYGLTQAALQIPFGMASDRFGRKPVIIFGLLVFAAGSLLAAVAPTIEALVVARAIQGAGAVSAAVSAFLADLTRDEVRARAMAMVGGAIGLSFAISLVLAPVVFGHHGLSGLFLLTAALAGAACLVVWRIPPAAKVGHALGEPGLRVADLLRLGQLNRLHVGIFSMMAVQTAMFVAIPLGLDSQGLPLADHWMVYLPLLLLSFAAMVPIVFWAERKGRFRFAFLLGIGVLMTAMSVFLGAGAMWHWFLAIWVFMVGFNLLEALLPSWVSRVAPQQSRGMALGLYTTAQSLGLFVGGAMGGWVAGRHGIAGIFLVCLLILLFWLVVALGLREIGSRRASFDRPSAVG